MKYRRLQTAALLFLSPAILRAEELEGGASLFDLLRQGGWAMWPLGFLSLAFFFLLFHCWQQTGLKRFTDPVFVRDIREPLAARDLPAAQKLADSQTHTLARLFAAALPRARANQPDARRAAVEEAFAEHAEAEDNSVGQWINYLNVVASVAPMVGLLGTVSGMIGAFQKIGQAGMGRPEELAGNIGEALITTATGLVIGIPAMIAYFYFRNRLNNRMVRIHQEGADLIETLADAPPVKPPAKATAGPS
ncbi:MAG: MotA/TolQ/ExbB proton channel family protein [Opitutales bacterium]|nr:MotA/TolQ/ExbB proton channel family protein [Opitutales bacterium]